MSSVSHPGIRAGVQCPSSRMRRHLRGLWFRFGVNNSSAHPLTFFEQLCYLGRPISRDILPTREPGIQFFSGAQAQAGWPDWIEVTEGVGTGFVAGSENGFLVGEGSLTGGNWKCTLAGARCSLSW